MRSIAIPSLSHPIEAMTWLTRTEPGLLARIVDFDTDGYLPNVSNGTVDLRTGQLRLHGRADRRFGGALSARSTEAAYRGGFSRPWSCPPPGGPDMRAPPGGCTLPRLLVGGVCPTEIVAVHRKGDHRPHARTHKRVCLERIAHG